MSHAKLKEEVRKAIQELFGDTSVSPSTTRQSLEEIKEEIQDMIYSLPEDEA